MALNSTGKVLVNTIISSFVCERNPLYSVNRTLNAIDSITERCAKSNIKQLTQEQSMQMLAKYTAAAMKGESVEEVVVETAEDPMLTFIKEQSKVNKAILKHLGGNNG